MITMITGLPGNGKTLFALWYIKQKAEKEGREVYYHRIKDLMLPWTENDPEKWMDLPDGSMIVLDEAQYAFPKRPNGSKYPDHYEKLTEHRHSGKDIFLITQHPSLVDNYVRKLVGQHFHCIRKFGLERSTIYEWSSAQDAPEKVASQKNAVTLKWAFPKEVYGYYKSAEVHTVKRAIPAKLILAICFVVAVPAIGYYALDRFQNRYTKEGALANAAPAPGAQPPGGYFSPGGAPGGSPGSSSLPPDPLVDAKNFAWRETPRVEGLPQTAPKYDELTKPTSVPVPAMCIRRGSYCQCYSQQATKINLPFNQCVDIAYNGYFQDFEPDPGKAKSERAAPVHQQASGAPAPGANVLALNEVQSIPVSAVSSPEERQAGHRRAIVGSVR